MPVYSDPNQPKQNATTIIASGQMITRDDTQSDVIEQESLSVEVSPEEGESEVSEVSGVEETKPEETKPEETKPSPAKGRKTKGTKK